ncbi:MAG: TonB-dependent receptor [Acidobacteria bacterium]|nr:TonB-dependent receptor [Acidobacteriota bacterium]MDA1236201.1 TonB-dependent receptor [Acidobacteriota bacterium]
MAVAQSSDLAEADVEAPQGDQTPAAEVTEEASQRTELNLLGQVDASSGEGRRNENVSLTLIDNNVLKELNLRMGTTATLIQEFEPERKYFGKEFGGSAAGPLHVNSASSSGIHGDLNWKHGNSLFSARSFFQVGKVQPSRSNDYGGALTAPLWSGGHLTLTGGQRKLRGQVNGNVLVPAADERTPTTTDPAKLAIVNAILGSYPDALPNRTDINKRALNTNAPQNIGDHRAGATVDQKVGERDRLIMKYNLTLQNVDAFQLVGGQNPDTTTKNHDARLTWSRVWNPSTTTDFSAGFSRVSSVLTPDESSLGPMYYFGNTLQLIGPTTSVPLDRAQNTFRYAGRLQKTEGNHTLNFGFDFSRRQINGFEGYRHRGLFRFGQAFGRTLIENILEGTPTVYFQGIGNAHRGFRSTLPTFFFGDVWRASSRLTLNIGLRYEPAPAPYEVDDLSEIPYDCDCNNLAPSFGFAYRANDKWGVFRGSYGLHYGEIFSTGYMRSRFNPPGVINLNVAAPDIVNPLKDFSVDDLDPNGRTDFTLIDTELATPYSHQYNFSWEMRPVGDWTLELGYVGSRSHKLLTGWAINRARQVPGVVSTATNVNDRRPDPRYGDVTHILNGSRAFYDAAKVTLRVPEWAGFSIDASYWWSKAIDLGSDYTNTASSMDSFRSLSPSEFDVHARMKGPSNFDQPHSFLFNAAYATSSDATGNRWLDKIVGSWQMTVVLLLKSGSPFTVQAGADGPGIGNVDGSVNDRPNLIDPSVLRAKANHPDTSQAALPRAAFDFASSDQLSGNLGRNTFRKDGVFNVNASLARTFPMRGDMSMELRAESLNLLNHAQFEAPGFSANEANFGQITNTLNDGRAFQFTLNLSF